MSIEPNYGALGSRVLDIAKAKGGRISIADVQEAHVMQGSLIRETLRRLIAGKQLVMDQGDTYSLPGTPAPPSPAPTSARVTPASPQKVAANNEGGTKAVPLRPCLRCRLKYPPEHYARADSGQPFKLCAVCRTTPAPKGYRAARRLARENGGADPITGTAVDPLVHAPAAAPPAIAPAIAAAPPAPPVPKIRTLEELAARWTRAITIVPSDPIRAHLEQLVATGFYGRTITDAADRLIAEGIQRALHTGAIKRLGGNGND